MRKTSLPTATQGVATVFPVRPRQFIVVPPAEPLEKPLRAVRNAHGTATHASRLPRPATSPEAVRRTDAPHSPESLRPTPAAALRSGGIGVAQGRPGQTPAARPSDRPHGPVSPFVVVFPLALAASRVARYHPDGFPRMDTLLPRPFGREVARSTGKPKRTNGSRLPCRDTARPKTASRGLLPAPTWAPLPDFSVCHLPDRGRHRRPSRPLKSFLR